MQVTYNVCYEETKTRIHYINEYISQNESCELQKLT